MKTQQELEEAINKMRVTVELTEVAPHTTPIAKGMLSVLLWVTGEDDYFGQYLLDIETHYNTLKQAEN